MKKSSIHCNETKVALQEGEIMSPQAHKNYDRNKHKWNNYFFVTHEPTFSCGYERKIGSRADGGKWICDPHCILKGQCLVYSGLIYLTLSLSSLTLIFFLYKFNSSSVLNSIIFFQLDRIINSILRKICMQDYNAKRIHLIQQ